MSQHEGREAWVHIPTEEDLRAQLAQGDQPSPFEGSFIPAMARLLAAHDQIGPLFRDLVLQIMFGPGSLSRREREMLAAVTSAAQDCHY